MSNVIINFFNAKKYIYIKIIIYIHIYIYIYKYIYIYMFKYERCAIMSTRKFVSGFLSQ